MQVIVIAIVYIEGMGDYIESKAVLVTNCVKDSCDKDLCPNNAILSIAGSWAASTLLSSHAIPIALVSHY